MKKTGYILLLLCCIVAAQAQVATDSVPTPSASESSDVSGTNSAEQTLTHSYESIRPIEKILRLQYGGIWAQDSYLSPLLYSGQYIGLGAEWWRNMKVSPQWKSIGIIDLKGGLSYNSQHTNYTYNLGIRGGWGAAWQKAWKTGAMPGVDHSEWKVYAGPYLDLDFTARELYNNVNKPVSFDLAADIDALAGIEWTLHKGRGAYRLRYLARINLIGIEWLPDYWTSYYEVSEGVDLKVACGWPGNRQSIHQELTVDMRFKRIPWRLGIEHEYLRYGREDMHFSRQTVGVVLGMCLDYMPIQGLR